MSIVSLDRVLSFFRGESKEPVRTAEFVKEVLVMTLSRATRADTNVSAVEVDSVRKVIRDATGEDLTTADIRVAASSELFETMALEDALARLRRHLETRDRIFIVNSLAEVIRSDARVNDFELDYFDSVVNALEIRPAEVAGLTLRL